MAKEELDAFFEALRRDSKLAEAFAQATGNVVRENGYDVDDQDIFDRFNNDPTDDGRLPPPVRRSTMAMGEEGGRVTSAAMGEEGGRMSTMAVGEEGGPRFRR
jgi:hypothetical protein